MKYVEMSIEDAFEYCKSKGNKTVLVAVQNLEEQNSIAAFSKKRMLECEEILEKAETIVKMNDEFVNQLRCFTHKQIDVINITPKGLLSTILVE